MPRKQYMHMDKSMNDTPKTDAALDDLAEDQRGQVHYNGGTFIEHAKQLERELAAVKEILLETRRYSIGPKVPNEWFIKRDKALQ